MLKAERRCRHLFTGGVCFSLKVAEPLAVLIFWELVISRRKGVVVCSRRIKRQKKAAKVTKAVALMDMKELKAQFRAAKKAYQVAKKGHRESRIAFIDTFPAKDRDRIKRNKVAREMGRIAKLITGKLESKKVTSVLYQGRPYNTKQGIDQVLLPINEAKVWASEDTAFRISPLRQVFGDMGNQEAEDAVLAGTYQEPHEGPGSFCNMPRNHQGLSIVHLEYPRRTTSLL